MAGKERGLKKVNKSSPPQVKGMKLSLRIPFKCTYKKKRRYEIGF